MSDAEKGALEKEDRQQDAIEAEVVPASALKDKKIVSEAPPSHSIEDPRRIIRQGRLIIFLFFGVLGVWSIFGTISGAVVAPGKVKIETERKTVQHLEGGIVDAILVREGDEVTAGQPLITLQSIQIDASVESLRKQLVAFMAAQVRYTAEKNQAKTFTWPEGLKALAREAQSEDVLENEMRIFIARKEAFLGQFSMLKSQIAQVTAQISGLEEQLKAENAVIATLEEELKAKRQLFAERYLEKSQILELERMLATHQGSRGHLRQGIAETRQRRDETRLRMNDLTNRIVEEATSMLGKIDNEILQIREKLRPLSDAKTRLNVLAPVSGKVVSLQVHSKGGVIRSGEPLMDIVPGDTPMIVEVQVPVNKITEVYVGQHAQVQLDAFDVRITPLLPGKVVYISADRLEEKTGYGTMPYYLCYVEVDNKAVEKANVYLSPGMPATVFITTKERTVIYYMLEPLIKNWDRALRE